MADIGLNIGLQGLLTSQASLDTIGNNVTNANTPGYSRQSLDVSSAASIPIRNLLMGTGVQADTVKRTVDALLQARLVAQQAGVSRLGATLQVMQDAESQLGSTSSTGINSLMQDFFTSLSSLSATPEDPELRSGAIQSATQLTSQFNDLSNSFNSLKKDTSSQLTSHVAEVNTLAQQISNLNQQIQTTEASKVTANDLRDRRDQAVLNLSQLVDVKAIEDSHGSIRVLVGGSLLVSPTTFNTMQLSTASDGSVEVRMKGQTRPVNVTGGAIGGLLDVQQKFLPQVTSQLDSIAKNWILEVNRVHSTGVGGNGPFRQLVSTNPLQDVDQSGSPTDDLLSNAGLPFDVKTGDLVVNITNAATGSLEKHVIAIDASRTTVGDFVQSLNSIPNLSASIDGQGRLHMFTAPGYGFDFSARLDPDPDSVGSFGGGHATLSTANSGPFGLTDGDTLQLTGPSGPFSITFNASQFAQIGNATSDEIAAVVNADPNAQANGVVAASVGGKLVLQSAGTGASESFTVTGGSALAALGWNAGTTVTGNDIPVGVNISGAYTGASNDVYTFKPSGDGTVGTTPGLKVFVYDQSGAQVAALDIGAGYKPGDQLNVVNGVQVSFGFGTLSATHNDFFRVDVASNSDTSDVLPALGLNSLFTGKDAASIGVSADIAADPSLLATSASGATGDGSNLSAMLQLDSKSIDGLSNLSFGQSFSDLVSGVGLDVSSSQNSQDAEQFLLQSIQARRDQVSGVNVDEELTNMLSSQQAYQASAQFIKVTADMSNQLMQLL